MIYGVYLSYISRQNIRSVGFVLVQIFLASFFVKVVAFAVDDDDERHILYIQLAQCLGAEILIRDELCLLVHFASSAPAPPMAPK